MELAGAVEMREYATVAIAVKCYTDPLRADAGAQKQFKRLTRMLILLKNP